MESIRSSETFTRLHGVPSQKIILFRLRYTHYTDTYISTINTAHLSACFTFVVGCLVGPTDRDSRKKSTERLEHVRNIEWIYSV